MNPLCVDLGLDVAFRGHPGICGSPFGFNNDGVPAALTPHACRIQCPKGFREVRSQSATPFHLLSRERDRGHLILGKRR